jgi:acyl-CoA thioesterase-1
VNPDTRRDTPVVTLFGDSICAGYGLPPSAALPAQLGLALSNLGTTARIIGAGVNGDTLSQGLARVSTSVPSDTDLCVVALGANDLMQAVPPSRATEALDAIITSLRNRGIGILLCGMKAPPWLTHYAPAFDALFPAVAARHAVPLYPFLLDGVALDPRLNQRDRIHPNAEGIGVIAQRLAPAVKAALGDLPPL